MTLKDMLPTRSSKNAAVKEERIVVKLHGLVVDKKNNKLVPREPYFCSQDEITAEELEFKVAQHLDISNFALPLFGLCRMQQQHCDWVLPSAVIKSGEVLNFSLRLEFADQTRLVNVVKHCGTTMDYIYGQVREGFVNKLWDLGDINSSDYAGIITTDMQCHGYSLGLKASELKKTLNFEKFSGPYYNGIKALINKSAVKDHCLKGCSEGYSIKDNNVNKQENIDKEIRNCKYSYVADVLKRVTLFGSTYKCQDGKSLVVSSKDQDGHSGLQIISKESVRLVPASNICTLDVIGGKLEITSLDTTGPLRKETFLMQREEDACSLGLLINVLYKLSVNYMTDLWLKARKHKDQLFQEILCHPPISRRRWMTLRLQAVNKIQKKCRYIISEDFQMSGNLNVLCLDTKQSPATTMCLVLKRDGHSDVWFIEGEDKTGIHLENLNVVVAERLGCEVGSISPVPLLLPYSEVIYHCRKREHATHQPIVLNKYTLQNYICGKTSTSVYAAKANFRRTAKSKAVDIAIKRLEDPGLYKGFTDMIRQMTHWRHENLIRLHGVSFANGVEAIVDYFGHGNLRDFINYGLSNQDLKLLHLVKVTEQLLRALIYLQERITVVEKEPGDISSYHGNIKMSKLMVDMFSEDDIFIKLGDPGLNKITSSSWLQNPAMLKKLPWCAPELMQGQACLTSFTDIYALGVTIWEIWSAGLLPFREINNKTQIMDRDKVKLINDYVKSGGRLTKPHWASPALYELMMDCWKAEPVLRPSPQTLQRQFHASLPSVNLQEVCQKDQVEHTFDYDKMDWNSVEERPDEIQQNIANFQEEAAVGLTQTAPTLVRGQQKAKDIAKRDKQIASINIQFLDKTLGKGSFGTVKEALLDYSDDIKKRRVAVKACLSDNDENTDTLMNEINIMTPLVHENVVKIEGYVVEKGSWHLVMEFMAGGSLREFVKNIHDVPFLTLAMLAQDTAKGMAYLVSMNVIHKDLAARNVLLTGTRGSRVVAKISDFGLSRILQTGDVYTIKQKKSPWKWYPPEALARAIFTMESDVWSYGCVVWEMFDRCKHDLSLVEGKHALVEHRDKLLEGKRKEKPEHCPPAVYDNVIWKCWEHDGVKRPKFTEIVDIWSGLIPQNQ